MFFFVQIYSFFVRINEFLCIFYEEHSSDDRDLFNILFEILSQSGSR